MALQGYPEIPMVHVSSDFVDNHPQTLNLKNNPLQQKGVDPPMHLAKTIQNSTHGRSTSLQYQTKPPQKNFTYSGMILVVSLTICVIWVLPKHCTSGE